MRRFAIAAALLFTLPVIFGADFPVTTAADSGPGSLRQAILDANRATDCTSTQPCTIVLPKVEAPDGVSMRIDLASPLPAITASNLRVQPIDSLSGIYVQRPAVEIPGPALPGATEYRIWYMAPRHQPKIAFRGADAQASVSLPSGSEWCAVSKRTCGSGRRQASGSVLEIGFGSALFHMSGEGLTGSIPSGSASAAAAI